MRIYLAALTLIFASCLNGQIEFDGCHFYKNKAHKHQKPTKHQLELLEKSVMESDTFDILNYDLTLDITDYSNQMLIAAAKIQYVNLFDGIQDINFELFNLTVDSVKQNDALLSFNYDTEVLSIDLETPSVLNDTSSIEVFYHGVPYKDPFWGGFYFQSNYVYNLGIGLTTIPPYFGKVWYPCFDNFKERATYDYHVKSAGGRVPHCQGDLVGETFLDGDTLIRDYHFKFPIPTHLSAIAAADYDTHAFTHTGAFGDIEVTLKAKPNQLPAMVNDFVNIGDCIDALEFWFGPYVWERVGYVTTTDGALEIPQGIAYPDFMPSQNQGTNESLYAHELGHLWWGDLVTPDIHNNMWLKEGNAEYSEYLFFEYEYGQEVFIDILKDNQENILKTAHLDDDGYQALSPMPDEQIYGTHTYQKGASVMHNLRGYLGDTLYRQGMTALRDSLEFNYMTPIMMRDILTEATGFDLTDFFDDQIYKPGYSVFVIDSVLSVENGNQYDHNVYLQQKLHECPSYYGHVPLEITCVDQNWDEHHFLIDANGQYSSASFSTDFEPLLVYLNGRQRLNQARLDLNFIENETGGSFSTVDRTEFRLKVIEMNEGDSAFIRVNHVWSGPDNENLDDNISTISNSHYWIIDGILPSGTALSGKVNYRGSVPDQHFDEDLVAVTEDSLIMVYRPDASFPWIEHPYYFKTTGSSTTNANGSVTVDSLWIGEYAFANGMSLVSTNDLSSINEEFSLYPNPSRDEITVSGTIDIDGLIEVEIFDIRGLRLKHETFSHFPGLFQQTIDISDLASGNYYVRLSDSENYVMMVKKLEIIH
ncbi:MAG: M1 family aminopeptidase [Bacteroidota bacterium]